MKRSFSLGTEVNLNAPTGREPFCEERAKIAVESPTRRETPKTFKMAEKGQELNKTRWLFNKDNILIGHIADIQSYYNRFIKKIRLSIF
jgi:hypothetical protein